MTTPPASSSIHASSSGTNYLRLFAEEEVDHGVFGSACAPSYVPFFDEAAAKILEQCSLLIPQ